MISVHDLEKKFANHSLVCSKLSIDKGSTACISGPTGIGKTSLLRMIAGLLTPDSGLISINGNVVFDGTNMIDKAPPSRDLSFVMQEDALIPHLTIAENCALVAPSSDFELGSILEQLGIMDYSNTPTNDLSGGQKKRAALARSLYSAKPIVLMDEPFSALDQQTKQSVIQVLANMQEDNNLTFIITTHDTRDLEILSPDYYRINPHGVLESGIFGNNQNIKAEIVDICKKEDSVQTLTLVDKIGQRYTIQQTGSNYRIGQRVNLCMTDGVLQTC